MSNLGGKVLREPFDVFDAGRMAVIADPQGAVCMLWTANNYIGCGRQDEPGSPCWFELMTTDAKGAVAFYNGLLKSTSQVMPMPDSSEYHLLSVAGKERAGVMQITEQMAGMPPVWSVYFGVEDIDASVALIKEMGGAITFEPMDIPDGNKMAGATDSDGISFGLFMET